MIGPVGLNRASAIASVRIGGPGGTRTRAGAAMRGLAGRVATAFAHEFDLLGDGHPKKQHRPEADPYDVNGAARELTQGLGGGPVDEGRFVRSLAVFVVESASLVGARPESRSLQRIDEAIGQAERGTGPETLDGALRSIDRTAALVAAGARR